MITKLSVGQSADKHGHPGTLGMDALCVLTPTSDLHTQAEGWASPTPFLRGKRLSSVLGCEQSLSHRGFPALPGLFTEVFHLATKASPGIFF